MTTILTVIHIIVCLFLVIIVLLQQGKGANAGATLGGGGSQTMFGSEGPMPLMNKITTGAAIVFMVTSISLAYISAHRSGSSVMEDVQPKQESGLSLERGLDAVPGQTEEGAPVAPADNTANQDAAAGQKSQTTPVFPSENKGTDQAANQ